MSANQATSDEVLIGRIAQGDRLAMQVLFARHHVRVFRFTLRLVRNEATAEDLISHARAGIAGYKVPRTVDLRTEPLPLSAAMKVLKRELRAPYWADQDRTIN